MLYKAKAPIREETALIVSAVIYGDSIYLKGIFTRIEKEIRLYCSETLETRRCRKLREVEEKTRIAGEMLRFWETSQKNLFNGFVLPVPW